MSEIEDIIGIYGAIDRAVIDHPERRATVSKLLPVYQAPDVHWFDDFEAWTIEKREEDTGPPFPETLNDALLGLAETTPSGRMRARRLFAIAVAAQAFPELRDPYSESAAFARDALSGETLVGGSDAAERLLELLGDESVLPRADDPGALDAWWENLLASGLIAEPDTMGPRVCSGRLVMVPGVGGPVTALETEFETSLIDFDRATRFLEPQNWRNCSDFWCRMDKLGEKANGVHQYHEQVSTDCTSKPRAWTIEAELDFSFREMGTEVAITDYWLTEGVPQPDVRVDEGSLVVRQIGSPAAPKLRIKTTKRIKFKRPFSGEALAMIMCALGYASVVEDLVFTCGALNKGPGTNFPGHPLVTPGERAGTGTVRVSAKPASAEAGARSGTPRTSAGPKDIGPDFGPVIKDIADKTATAVKECIDDWADAAQASFDKIGKGDYTANEMAQDMADMWSRMAREWAKAVDLALDNARTAGRAQRRKPSAS